jgi:ubiquinone/menaquinone biosynthesis C-methylase UbiE
MPIDDKHGNLNAEKWNARAETYDQRRFDFMRFMQKRTIALVALKPGISLLDIGCGTGWAMRYTAKLLDGKGNFHGIDISPRMIERAIEQTSQESNIQFHVANAEALPFPDESFDVLLCTNSFHHYKNPIEVLVEMKRVLRPDGMLYVTDLTRDSLLGKLLDDRYRKKEQAHVKYYSTKEYQHMFAEAGLEYIKTKTITITTVKVHIGKKKPL